MPSDAIIALAQTPERVEAPHGANLKQQRNLLGGSGAQTQERLQRGIVIDATTGRRTGSYLARDVRFVDA